MKAIKIAIIVLLFFTYYVYSMEKEINYPILADYLTLQERGQGDTRAIVQADQSSCANQKASILIKKGLYFHDYDSQDAKAQLRLAIERGDIAKIDELKSSDEHKHDTMMRLRLENYLNEVKTGRRPEVYGTLCTSKSSN